MDFDDIVPVIDGEVVWEEVGEKRQCDGNA